MAHMLIRNIPNEVLAAFRILARERGVSQEEAARQLIEREVHAACARTDFAKRAAAWRRKFREEGRTFGDSTEVIRRMRDSR